MTIYHIFTVWKSPSKVVGKCQWTDLKATSPFSKKMEHIHFSAFKLNQKSQILYRKQTRLP